MLLRSQRKQTSEAVGGALLLCPFYRGNRDTDSPADGNTYLGTRRSHTMLERVKWANHP